MKPAKKITEPTGFKHKVTSDPTKGSRVRVTEGITGRPVLLRTRLLRDGTPSERRNWMGRGYVWS